jgi:hypothetical protein
MDKICNKISGNLFVIKRLSSIVDLHVLYTAYYGLVYPILTYRIAVWGHSFKKDIQGMFLYCKKGQSDV